MFKKLIAGAAVGLSLAMAPAAAFADTGSSSAPATQEPAQDNATCVNGHWPLWADGQPKQFGHGTDATFIWHDTTGWHLRATHAGQNKAVIEGGIRSDGPIYAVARRTEGNDVVASKGNGHTVAFRFTNYGFIDGIDFKIRCGQHVSFTVKMNGTKEPATDVYLGAEGHHPKQVPFVIHRVRPANT